MHCKKAIVPERQWPADRQEDFRPKEEQRPTPTLASQAVGQEEDLSKEGRGSPGTGTPGPEAENFTRRNSYNLDNENIIKCSATHLIYLPTYW